MNIYFSFELIFFFFLFNFIFEFFSQLLFFYFAKARGDIKLNMELFTFSIPWSTLI